MVNVGGLTGGRLVVSGTDKSHSIYGTINIYFAICFTHTSASTSTVSLYSGAFVTTYLESAGQLFIDYGINMVVSQGAVLNNNCVDQSECGISIAHPLPVQN